MADNVNRYRRGPRIELLMPKSGTVAIAKGDLLKRNSSGQITPATTSADASGLFAIADGASPATNATADVVPVLLTGYGTVFEFICGTTTDVLTVGELLKITAAQTLSLKAATNPTTTATQAVGFVAKAFAVSGSSVQVIFKPSKWNAQVNRGSSGTVV